MGEDDSGLVSVRFTTGLILNCNAISGANCSPKTAPIIWAACNAQLALPEFGSRSLLDRMKVRAVGTTDDPADSGTPHQLHSDPDKPVTC